MRSKVLLYFLFSLLVLSFIWILTPNSAFAQEVINDPLTNGTTKGSQHGGTFTAGGWKTTGDGDYIEYQLAKTIKNGSFEFDVKGFGPSPEIFTATDFKQYFAAMYDGSWDGGQWGSWAKLQYNPYKAGIRIYGYDTTDTTHEKWGHLKLRLNVAEYNDPTSGANSFERYTIGWWDWNPNVTYHFKLAWGNGYMILYKDGVEIENYGYVYTGEEYAPPLHMIRIGAFYYPVPVGITFSHVHVRDEAGTDTIAPTVLATKPTNGQTGVSIDSDIAVTFSETMDKTSTQNAFSSNPTVTGSFAWSSNVLYFNPDNSLAANTQYTVNLSTQAKDSNGNVLAAPFSFSFRIGETAPTTLKKYDVFETTLSTTQNYSSPYQQVNVTGTFRAPSGKTLTIDGFWDSGKNWKVRMAPNETGHWTYEITSNDAQLAKNGSFDVTDSSAHGFVKKDPTNPYAWVYDDGTPYFWMGDTSWRGFTDLVPFESRFKPYIDLRDSQKFNHVHSIIVSYIGGVDRWQNEGGHAFEVNGTEFNYDKINPEYFKWIDKRIEYAMSKGMTYGLYFTWAQEYAKFSFDQFKKYAEYLVGRYSAYNVFWTISGEFDEFYTDFSDQDPRFEEQAQNVYNKDPYKHPITFHPTGRSSSNRFGNQSWLGYVAEQSPYWHRDILRDRQYQKPVVNEEYGYAGDVASDDVRKGAWSIVTAGGYFTAGFMTTYAPDKGGWDLNAYSTEAGWLTNVYNFFSKNTAFNKMNPHDELLTSGTGYVLAEPGKQYVAYLPDGGSFSLNLSSLIGNLTATWFNPRSGEYSGQTSVSGGAARSFTPPFSGDAVLLINSGPTQTRNGDLNNDGNVDIFDYNILVGNFGKTDCGNVADIDGNCKVDIFDYNILLENFGL